MKSLLTYCIDTVFFFSQLHTVTEAQGGSIGQDDISLSLLDGSIQWAELEQSLPDQ
jgi:hypothetical protein